MTEGRAALGPLPLPGGFAFSAVAAGLKASGRLDLALAEAAPGTTGAAVFTRNRVVAAPLLVGRASLEASRGRVRALLVNSGNANCATGKAGRRACERVCREASRLLGARPEEIFPSSTGIIGVPLPVERILGRLGELFAGRRASEDALRRFAEALRTTDTRSKLASATIATPRGEVRLVGVAKGSGMIHPRLATMLAYVFTDVGAPAGALRLCLRRACDESFNCISVDGDTSTNDTVLLLASGRSGVRWSYPGVARAFAPALGAVCRSLAEQVVRDGEGVTRVVRLVVEEARGRDEALRVARAIAHSPLVKTAWAGADPNWGRILAAVGSSGVQVDPGRLDIFIGAQRVCRGGAACDFDVREAHAHLSQPTCDVRVRLRRGRGRVLFWTTDLTAEYVKINADYST